MLKLLLVLLVVAPHFIIDDRATVPCTLPNGVVLPCAYRPTTPSARANGEIVITWTQHAPADRIEQWDLWADDDLVDFKATSDTPGAHRSVADAHPEATQVTLFEYYGNGLMVKVRTPILVRVRFLPLIASG